MKENFVIEYFDVVLFMKQKQRRKKRKERDKNKEAKYKAKKKDRKEERQKRRKDRERERERQRKRNLKNEGGQKKLREKQRETLKNKQIMPFSRGKNKVFLVLQSKERKGTTRNQKKQKKKIGGFRAK